MTLMHWPSIHLIFIQSPPTHSSISLLFISALNSIPPASIHPTLEKGLILWNEWIYALSFNTQTPRYLPTQSVLFNYLFIQSFIQLSIIKLSSCINSSKNYSVIIQLSIHSSSHTDCSLIHSPIHAYTFHLWTFPSIRSPINPFIIHSSIHSSDHSTIFPCTHPPIHYSFHPSTHPFTSPSTCDSFSYTNTHLSIHPSIHPLICLSTFPIHLPIHGSIQHPLSSIESTHSPIYLSALSPNKIFTACDLVVQNYGHWNV